MRKGELVRVQASREDSLELLVKATDLPGSPDSIAKKVAAEGVWEASEEWRIFTVTNFKILQIKKDRKSWFRVEVKCDHEFSCHCPTLERAMQMARLYQGIIRESFHQLGWPSWEEKQTSHNKRVERTRKKRRAAHARR